MVTGHTPIIYVLRHLMATKANIASLLVMQINRVQHNLRDLVMPPTNIPWTSKKASSFENTHISKKEHIHHHSSSTKELNLKKYSGNTIKLADLMYDFQKSVSTMSFSIS